MVMSMCLVMAIIMSMRLLMLMSMSLVMAMSMIDSTHESFRPMFHPRHTRGGTVGQCLLIGWFRSQAYHDT